MVIQSLVMPSIALYQPDIAQNLGTTLRTAACFGCHTHIIEPCGFPFDDRKLKRSGMDYIDFSTITRHASWQHFVHWLESSQHRLILTTTKTNQAYTHFTFTDNDIIMAGRESAGVPDEVHDYCKNRVTIPMQGTSRSMNVAVSTAIILSEAVRQIR